VEGGYEKASGRSPCSQVSEVLTVYLGVSPSSQYTSVFLFHRFLIQEWQKTFRPEWFQELKDLGDPRAAEPFFDDVCNLFVQQMLEAPLSNEGQMNL
jgi:hypothetical protein